MAKTKYTKKTFRLLRQYKLAGLAVAAIIAGLILQFSGQRTYTDWLLGAVSLAAVVPLLWRMWQDIRLGTYGIDVLAITAIVTSVILRQYWAAVVVVVMLTGGEALEDYANRHAVSELDALLALAPEEAHVLKGRKTVDVPVKAVKKGDKIVVRPGEIVPVDAVILDGSGSFDESSLTGESLPHVSEKGDQILSGSVNLDGVITARAIHSAASSQYEQIIKLVQAASASRAPFVRLADRYSIPFTVLAYALGIGVWTISGQPIRFLEVIIVATPCPLLLAAPTALISGISRASNFGIIIKTGAALEKLATAKTIAFDKTGTLTRGEPQVDSITTYNSFSQSQVLGLAASLEQNSTHVLSQAIVGAAASKQIKPIKAKHISELSGGGLRAIVSGQEVMIGRLNFIMENGVELPPKIDKQARKHTATYVAVGQKLAGIIGFKDDLRPEAASTLQQLRALGLKHTLMVTGDHKEVANNVAKQLGIARVKGEALPADKLHAIEAIKRRPVVFVGDGINDAPVLMAADVGIALGARGSTAASESADIVLLKDDFGSVAEATAIAKRTFHIAKESILGGIVASVILMIIFASGHLRPITGAILQEVVDVVVILNALRAHVSDAKLHGILQKHDYKQRNEQAIEAAD